MQYPGHYLFQSGHAASGPFGVCKVTNNIVFGLHVRVDFCYDLISLLINQIIRQRKTYRCCCKQTGQLRPYDHYAFLNDKGVGMAPAICSTASGPELRTAGINNTVVASEYNWPGEILSKSRIRLL